MVLGRERQSTIFLASIIQYNNNKISCWIINCWESDSLKQIKEEIKPKGKIMAFRDEIQGSNPKQANFQIRWVCNVRKKSCFLLCLFSLAICPEGNSARKSETRWVLGSSCCQCWSNLIESIKFLLDFSCPEEKLFIAFTLYIFDQL